MSSVEIGKYIAESPVDETENTLINSMCYPQKAPNTKTFLDTLLLTYLKLDYVSQLEIDRPIALMKRIKKKKCRTNTSRRGWRKARKVGHVSIPTRTGNSRMEEVAMGCK